MSGSDRRELTDDLGILLRAALPWWQSNIWTALPAIVTKVNASAGTLECNPTIQLRKVSPNGKVSWIDFPTLVDCPIVFPSGGGFTLTFPIAPDDEVLVIFASRCIDSWFASGKNGIQNELRMHDPSDGFAICGPRSYPNRLPVSTTNVQLRNGPADTFIEITPTQQVNVQAVNSVTVTAPSITLHGNVTIAGNLSLTGTFGAPGLPNYATHTHLGVQTGGGTSGPPKPGS